MLDNVPRMRPGQMCQVFSRAKARSDVEAREFLPYGLPTRQVIGCSSMRFTDKELMFEDAFVLSYGAIQWKSQL